MSFADINNNTGSNMAELKPCPFCGEKLIEHEDHHGKWIAHREGPGKCIMSHIQLFDKKDYLEWNTRTEKTNERET